MSTSNDKVYLIIGANRGLGLALVKNLAGKDGVKVIGSMRRDATRPTRLTDIAFEYDNTYVVSVEVTDLLSLQHAAKTVQKDFNIDHIDVLIMNAAITGDHEGLEVVKKENFLNGFSVNVLGPILAYQAFRPLLDATSQRTNHKAIFASISSTGGSTGSPIPLGNITYTTSKAALNHVSAQINLENENILAVAIHPGLVETDMSSTAASESGKNLEEFSEALGIELLTADQSATKILQVINYKEIENYAGKFVDYKGKILPL